MIAMIGMRISGKMSTGVRSAASGPTSMMVSASTTNVYGRRNAMRTIPNMPQTLPVTDSPPQRVLSPDHDFYAASHNVGAMVSDFGLFVQMTKLRK
jgi:hypothetical protein